MATRLAPLAAALALVLAGRLGGPSAPEGVSAAAEGPAPAVEERWWNGTVAGPNVVVASLNPDIVAFDVPEGAARLDLGLTARGGAALAWIFPAGCDSTSCGTRVDTGSGGTWGADAPPAGDWEVHVAKEDPGVAPVDYALVVQLRASSGRPPQHRAGRAVPGLEERRRVRGVGAAAGLGDREG